MEVSGWLNILATFSQRKSLWCPLKKKLDTLEKIKVSCYIQESNQNSSVVEPNA